MTMTVRMLTEEIEILQIEQEIQDKVKTQIDKNQRDYYLREQAKAISEELGESEDGTGESAEYLKKIEQKNLPDDVREKMNTEAKRLAKMQPSSPESGVIRGWLDICLELPWNEVKPENDDIRKAKEILEADHYGLEKVKERILEFFAVKNLTGGVKGQILCLVGPPGVGKTSVARSIARCMPPPVSAFEGIVGREPVPVEDKISALVQLFSHAETIDFQKLVLSAASRSEVVAIFLAVLELSKSHKVLIEDTEDGYQLRLAPREEPPVTQTEERDGAQ